MTPNASPPPGFVPQQNPAGTPNDGMIRGDGQKSAGQQSREKSLADTNYEPPGSGSSMVFVFFLIAVFVLFIAALGVLIWMLVKSL